MRDLGVSQELTAQIVAWADAWQTRTGVPEHDAEAARLIRLLRAEVGGRYRIVYHP